jgi:GT2 family glycosyltransferase
MRVPWISGACHLIPRDVFESVGPLTEETFCGFDDYDYCYRVTKANFEVWLCPAALMTHYSSVAVRQRWASWDVEQLAMHNTYVILSNHWSLTRRADALGAEF